MQHLEGSGTPVLYIGRTVLKDYISWIYCEWKEFGPDWSCRNDGAPNLKLNMYQFAIIFLAWPDRLCGPPNLLYNGYRVFPEGKERPKRDADPSPPSRAVGHERVQLYLCSPYGPYGMKRASVPVQGWSLPFYVFRATMCPSSGETTVFMWHLVLVILYGWLSGMQGEQNTKNN